MVARRETMAETFVTDGYWYAPGPSQVGDPRDFLPDAENDPAVLAHWDRCCALAEAGIPWPAPEPGEWGMGLNREQVGGDA